MAFGFGVQWRLTGLQAAKTVRKMGHQAEGASTVNSRYDCLMDRALSYWRRVHRAAIKRIAGDFARLLTNIAVTLAALGAVVWGLLVFGSEDAARDELISRSIIAGCGLLFLVFQYLFVIGKIPAEWDKEQQEKIKSLEERGLPSISFEHNEKDNKHLEMKDILVGPNLKRYWVGRVAIRNVSEAESVERAEVTLVHYRSADGGAPRTVDQKLTAHSIPERIVDVHPRRAENFSLFRVREGKRPASLELGPFPDGAYLRLAAGRYAVKVTASARSMKHVYQMYVVEVDEHGKIKFEPWRPGSTGHDFSFKDVNQSGLAESR